MVAGKIRYVYVAAATLVLLLAGIIYAWSILNTPFQTQFGWSQAALGLNFTLTMGAFCTGLIVGGILNKRISLKKTMILSGVLVCAGFVITGTMSGNNIVVLYIAYAVFCGLGIGTVYNALISSIMGWFPDKRATVSGVLMMGFGASTLVFGIIANTIMDAVGWRSLYIGIGVTILVVFTLCSFLVKAYVPPKVSEKTPDVCDNKLREKKNEMLSDSSLQKSTEPKKPKEFKISQVLKTSSFWRFYGFEVFIAAVGACVISMARDMAIYVDIAETTAVMLVGVSSVSNGIGRIVAGMLFDKKGSLVTMRIVGIIALTTPLFMLLSSITGIRALFIPGIIFAGFSYGFTPVLSSGFMGKTYGMKNFPLNFSVASTFLFVASFSATVGGIIYGATGGFNTVFIFMAVIGVLAIVMGESLKSVSHNQN